MGLWTGKNHPATGTRSHVSPNRGGSSKPPTPSTVDNETTMELLKGAVEKGLSGPPASGVSDNSGTGTSSGTADAMDEELRALNEQLIKLVAESSSN